MSNYNPDSPILFLTGTVNSTSIISRYEYDDNSGLGPSGLNIPMVTEIEVTGISEQLIGGTGTRNPGSYTALDIKTGDWVSDETGKKCLEIISISEVSNGSITFRAKDVDAYSYKNFKANTFAGSSSICFFEVSDNGSAVISGDTSFFTDNTAIDKIQTRFAIALETERYRIEFNTQQTGLNIGDIVTVDSNGDLVQFGDAGAFDYKLGILTDLSYGDTIAYIKPFNKIVDNYKSPERLSGSVGDIYYTSNTNPGEIVTDSALGDERVFFQIKDAVPTQVRSTLANFGMEEGDSLVINGESIFAQLGVGQTKSPSEIETEVNLSTNIHNVAASVYTPPAIIESVGSDTANGDVVFVLDSGSGPSAPSVTIGDGVNSSTVTFSTSDEDGTAFGQPSWATITANQVAQDLNTQFVADGVDIVASTFELSSGVNNPTIFPGLRLTAGSGKSISITNGNADVFSQTFFGAASAMGMSSGTASPSTDEYITFTRQDGGDIMLQGLGSFVNTNGIVSSSAGSPALLLMIEDEAGGAGEVGVETSSDLNQTPSVTTADGDATGVFITYTPFSDSNVQILANGIDVTLGDGVKTKPCYFSGDGGTNARAIADITAGDQLYWNGSIIGYELDGTDEIDVIYDASSNDV